MDFDLNDDQSGILQGLNKLITTLGIEAPKTAVFNAYSQTLDDELADGGFLSITREEGFSLLDGALIVETLAKQPVSVEAAATILIAPALIPDAAQRPVAVVSGAAGLPARFLPQARALLVDLGDEARLIEISPGGVQTLDTLFAYPYGRLIAPETLPYHDLGAGSGAILRRRWRLAIAVEAAGLIESAIETVLEHVKSRQQFGRFIGSFQAIQHRLVNVAQIGQSARWLALRAAWSDTEQDAAIAAAYVQDSISLVCYELHQFCGAMSLTLEFPLHHWTYRLRALLGELGGSSKQAQAAAACWTSTAS